MRHFFLLLVCLSLISAVNDEKDLKRFEELTKIILNGSFKERKSAKNEISQLKISLGVIEERIKIETDPELIDALTTIIEKRVPWSEVKTDKWAKYPVFGMNDDGKPLYLVMTKIDDEIVLGKIWKESIGHFPHKGQETLVADFKIWHNPAQWRKWDKELKGMKIMGVNKNGKKVYAARAKLKDGIHLGTFIEGNNKAMLSWGGESHAVEDFEVMVDDGVAGESKLEEEIKNFKPVDSDEDQIIHIEHVIQF